MIIWIQPTDENKKLKKFSIGTDTNRMHVQIVGLENALLLESLGAELATKWPRILREKKVVSLEPIIAVKTRIRLIGTKLYRVNDEMPFKFGFFFKGLATDLALDVPFLKMLLL